MLVRSPAWMRMSPEGRAGQAVCASETHTILIGSLDGVGMAIGH